MMHNAYFKLSPRTYFDTGTLLCYVKTTLHVLLGLHGTECHPIIIPREPHLCQESRQFRKVLVTTDVKGISFCFQMPGYGTT